MDVQHQGLGTAGDQAQGRQTALEAPTIDARTARQLHQTIQGQLKGAADAALRLQATRGWVHLGDYPTFAAYLRDTFADASRAFISQVTSAAEQRRRLVMRVNKSSETAEKVKVLPEFALRTLRRAGEVDDQVEALKVASKLAARDGAEIPSAGHIKAAIAKLTAPPPEHADLAGQPVPEEMAAVFETGRTLHELARQARKIADQVIELAKLPGGEWLKPQEVQTHIKVMAREIDAAAPYSLCPCGGECDRCRGRRWLSKEQAALTD